MSREKLLTETYNKINELMTVLTALREDVSSEIEPEAAELIEQTEWVESTGRAQGDAVRNERDFNKSKADDPRIGKQEDYSFVERVVAKAEAKLEEEKPAWLSLFEGV